MSGKGQGPLAGVRVLDLTSVLMGPYATQIFADLGADVIKIEGPGGDTTRAIPPGPDPTRGAMFLNVNRGKRSLALDLKRPEAREVVLRLAGQADVFIHSMRAQAIARLGLDYAALSAANPRIVYANLYGYGREGPYRDYPAYDDIVQAASGVVDLQARLSGGEPTYVANVIADKVSGLTGAYAVIAAYLYVCFGAILLFKTAVLTQAGVPYAPLGLAAINLTTGGPNWHLGALFGWGLGLAIHGIVTLIALGGEGWRQRMLEREVERLRQQR